MELNTHNITKLTTYLAIAFTMQIVKIIEYYVYQ